MVVDLSSAEQGPANSSQQSSGQSREQSSEQNPATGLAKAAQPAATCPHCVAVMPANAAYCPGCGRSTRPLPAEERAVAAAAYLTFVAGGVILLLPAFRNHRFVRFHAWQSVLLWGIFFISTSMALVLSNVAAAMVFLLFGILASLAMLFLWIVLSMKAWEGERFELPVLGELAARLR